jgi:hypothetical protein
VRETSQCNFRGCERLAATTLTGIRICRKHFLSETRARLEACSHMLTDRSSAGTNIQLAWQFIIESAFKATDLMQAANNLDSDERAELAEILVRIQETSRRVRRSVRRAVSILVVLRGNAPEGSWEETTQTVDVSRYGARLKCRHLVEVEEIVLLLRPDTGRKGQARVVRCMREKEPPEIAVEFLSTDNYWDCDWTTEDAYCDKSIMDSVWLHHEQLIKKGDPSISNNF